MTDTLVHVRNACVKFILGPDRKGSVSRTFFSLNFNKAIESATVTVYTFRNFYGLKFNKAIECEI